MILSNLNNFQNRSIWPINRTLIDTTPPGQNGLGSNVNEISSDGEAPELEPHHQMQITVIPRTQQENYDGKIPWHNSLDQNTFLKKLPPCNDCLEFFKKTYQDYFFGIPKTFLMFDLFTDINIFSLLLYYIHTTQDLDQIMSNLHWEVGHMAHHQAGCTTKKIQDNFMLKVLQLFSQEKTIYESICLKNREKLTFFLVKSCSP